MRTYSSDSRVFGLADGVEGGAFLLTPRAHAACQREFEKITRVLVTQATAESLRLTGRAPDVKHAPTRCIVQRGRIAVSLTWLCGASASVAAGELLGIVWSGVVAPGNDPIPERRLQRPPTPPVALWEGTWRAVAGDASAWAWRPTPDDMAIAVPSAMLAEGLAARFAEALPPEPAPVA